MTGMLRRSRKETRASHSYSGELLHVFDGVHQAGGSASSSSLTPPNHAHVGLQDGNLS